METNKEQQPKHTHEPWILHNDNQHDQTHKSGWFCGDDKPFGYLLSEEDFNHAAKCVNALEGIEDPETWRMKINNDLSQLQIDLDHAHSVINDLQKYKTACESIIKDTEVKQESKEDVYYYVFDYINSTPYETSIDEILFYLKQHFKIERRK